MWSPPTGISPRCFGRPSANTATPVVPPPTHYGARRASERDHALRADARHFSAAEGDRDLADVLPYHVLRVADCLAHGLHGLVEVDDEPLADSVRRSLPDADYLRLVALGAALRDYDGDLARPQVEADEQVRFYIMTVA